MKILAGNSNRALSEAIAAYLEVPLTKCQVRRFADTAFWLNIQERSRPGCFRCAIGIRIPRMITRWKC